MLVIANKLFGFTPDYTLSMPWRLLLNMIEENSSLENTDDKKDEKEIIIQPGETIKF